MSATALPILEVLGLTKVFGGLVAVSDVSFSVERHEIFGVIGPNGAGKSTLFNLLAASYMPTAGRIVFDGHPTAGWPTHRLALNGMARTFQNLRLFADQSVLDNVMIGSYRRARAGLMRGLTGLHEGRVSEINRREQALYWLDFVGLSGLETQGADNLSFGQQRLLELARALALEPSLLLLDEPASGLNDSETERFATMLRKLPGQGVTVLLVEHNMKLMMSVAERIMVLDCGRKIAEGTPSTIQADPCVVEVYLGREDPA
jgi:branched-chain amino acid transport system ATP-binding protein